MSRRVTRRQFLRGSGRLGAMGALAPFPGLWPAEASHGESSGFFTAPERRTLDAALSRMIPAEGPGDWSAADAGAGDYIERLLTHPAEIFAGGPFRDGFAEFQRLPRVKRLAWEREVERLRKVYRDGLAALDGRAGGNFAALPLPELQDLVLLTFDLEGSDFFAALYDHTMEGVYGHPVYGGNRNFVGWETFCYEGDVHGVRFPGGFDPTADDRPWDKFGGYSPEEIAQPGACPGQGPVR